MCVYVCVCVCVCACVCENKARGHNTKVCVSARMHLCARAHASVCACSYHTTEFASRRGLFCVLVQICSRAEQKLVTSGS